MEEFQRQVLYYYYYYYIIIIIIRPIFLKKVQRALVCTRPRKKLSTLCFGISIVIILMTIIIIIINRYIATLPQILCFWVTLMDTRMPGIIIITITVVSAINVIIIIIKGNQNGATILFLPVFVGLD